MPTAPAADQIRLLDVQDIDLRAQQARHRRDHLPVLEQIKELTARANDLDEARVATSTKVSDLRRAVQKAEDDVQVVRDRAARDNARLSAGQGTPKDLQALQAELAVLGRRQEALEEVELEAMEALDVAEKEHASAKEQVEAIESQLTGLNAERDAAWRDLDAELATLATEREAAAAGLDAGLVALYEKLRASHGGIGAAALAQGQCLGCRTVLNPGDLRDIEAKPADAIVRCEECSRILVRGAKK
ncbi:zinc ribbon domain-containing protein [Demequina rhizosphaerae]|uniref:zinc ribbon domain-containing protein n=1 Tax=Demequina rhizosphaerae TaxID=1638985 RepID=UPI00078232E5|nr:C4-type zinc ribbon domain-containing protein [Demequina rhizosphaerae]